MSQEYRQFAIQEAQRQGLDPALVLGVIAQESNWNPAAKSPKGALGLMQLMPETARGLGVTDPMDWQQNIRGGVAYLKQQMDRFKDPKLALAAYNAGPGAVEKHGGVPPYKETQNYVTKITGSGGMAQPDSNPFDAIFESAKTRVLGSGQQPQQQEPASPQEAAAVAAQGPATANPSFAMQGAAIRARQEERRRSNLTPEQQQIVEAHRQMTPLEPSSLENGLAGAGKMVSDLGSGTYQLGAEIGNKVGLVSDQTVTDLRQQADETKARDMALMGNRFGLAGNILASIAATMPLTLGSQSVARAAAIGAGLGATAPVGVQDSRGQNTVLGGAGSAAGQVVGNAVGRAIAPVPNQLTAEQNRLLGVAQREGIPLDAAQQTGSRALANVNAALSNIPGTAGVERAKNLAQNRAFTQSVLRQLGSDADEATPAVLSGIRDRLNSQFNSITSRNNINTAPGSQTWVDFQLRIGDVGQRYALDALPAHQREYVTRVMRELIDTNGQISGRLYQNTRSRLSSQAWSADDPMYAGALRGIRDALDDLAMRTFNRGDAEALAAARQQWGMAERVNQAMQGAGGSSGLVSPGRLRSSLAAGSEGGYARGVAGGPMNDIARAGDAFLRQLPDSGTAQRTMYQNLLTGGIAAGEAGLGGGAGYLLSGGDPAAAVGGGLLSLFAPRVVQGVLSNPAVINYLASSPLRTQAGQAMARGVGSATVPGGAIMAQDIYR